MANPIMETIEDINEKKAIECAAWALFPMAEIVVSEYMKTRYGQWGHVLSIVRGLSLQATAEPTAPSIAVLIQENVMNATE